jgi:hypothetical protein
VLRHAGRRLLQRTLARAAEPGAELTNRSLIKYKLVIDDFGGWALFQRCCRRCKAIGDKHGTGIATVATRWVLDQPGVAAAIVGARYADHLAQTLAVFACGSTTRTAHGSHAAAGRAPRPRGRHLHARARQERPPRPHHEIQPQQELTRRSTRHAITSAAITALATNAMETPLATTVVPLAAQARGARCTHTVGMVVSLTGAAGRFGQAGAKSVELAFNDFNKAAGAAASPAASSASTCATRRARAAWRSTRRASWST